MISPPRIFSPRRRGHGAIGGPTGVARGPRTAEARGLYRVFNAAAFRFYRSNAAPPLDDAGGGTPFATSTTLPFQPTNTYADGTWWLSVSYFDGVLDSGFLPLGQHGESFLQLIIAGGAATPIPPSTPVKAQLQAIAGGVVKVVAFYSGQADQVAAGGGGAATQWAIAYTTNGTTPAVGTPTITPAITGTALAYNLPAQANGTTVKVQLQTRRPKVGGGWVYSAASAVMVAVATTGGPTAPLSIADGD